MKFMIRTACILATVVLLSVGPSIGRANADFLRDVISFDSPGTNDSWAFGTIFTVGPSNLLVTSLGAYDFGGDGFSTNGGIAVGIFDEESSVLLDSTNVLSSDPLIDSYRYSDTNIVLEANQQYRLVAVSGNDNYIQGAGTWTYTTNGLTVDSFGYGSSTELASLNVFTESDYGMGNLQFTVVPEPSSLLLFGIGVAMFTVNRRR